MGHRQRHRLADEPVRLGPGAVLERRARDGLRHVDASLGPLRERARPHGHRLRARHAVAPPGSGREAPMRLDLRKTHAPPRGPAGLVRRRGGRCWRSSRIVGDVLRHGLGQVDWAFLTESPFSSGRRRQSGPIIVSTMIVTGISRRRRRRRSRWAYGQSWLAEHLPPGDPRARRVRACLSTLAGVPSIRVRARRQTRCSATGWGMGFSLLSGGGARADLWR